MSFLRKGGQVLHPDHGIGTVLAFRSYGRIYVRFDAIPLMPRTVKIHDLVQQDKALLAPRVISAKRRKRDDGPSLASFFAANRKTERKIDRAELRQTLEALRMGVVPTHHVGDYTVARSAEMQSLAELFKTGRGLRLLWGDYGTGKTHMLDVAERLALREGFVTARVVLNPRDLPPSQPQRLYRAFLTTLRYPDEAAAGWETLFYKLIDSDRHCTANPEAEGYSRFFSPVLFALRFGDQDVVDWALDYVEGYSMGGATVTRALRSAGWQGETMLTLSDFRTYGRMYVRMLGTLACWAKDAGYRGLVLLMDEVEYVGALARQHRDLANEVLKHYAAAVLDHSLLCFQPGELYRGGHAVHKKLGLLYRPDQPLGVVMAFTPLRRTVEMVLGIVQEPVVHLHLSRLRRAEYLEVLQKVVLLFARAYPLFSPDPTHLRLLEKEVEAAVGYGDDSPREIVRTVVSVLDALRFGRDPFAPHHFD